MATITPVTDSAGAELPDSPGIAATSEQAARVETGTRRRPSGGLQAALAAALITGLLGLAAAAFNALNNNINTLHSNINALNNNINTLHSNINTLRTDVDADIDALRSEMNARFARMDERLDALSLTLLDHTDRLARIEAINSTGPHTHVQQPDTQQQE